MGSVARPRDPVVAVLAAMRASRPARSIRRFPHGSGGTSLVELDGRRVVLKAWPLDSPSATNLPDAFERMDVLRDRGVPIPAVLGHGEVAGSCFVVYELLPGRWPARIGPALLEDLIGAIDAARDAAPGEGDDWPLTLRSMLFGGDPLFDNMPAGPSAPTWQTRCLPSAGGSPTATDNVR
jgi:Phosphotransferase enzyme family